MPSFELSIAEVLEQKYVDVAVKIGLLPSKAEAVRLIKMVGPISTISGSRIPNTVFRKTL